jgi:hypothetical protein
MEEPSKESITYIIMLSAMQVVLNCQLELEGTLYDQGKVTQKVREAVNMLNLKNAANRNTIWKTDEINAANTMMGIQIIGEQIAKSDGKILHLLTNLTRSGIDLSRCVLKELTDEELREYHEAKKPTNTSNS